MGGTVLNISCSKMFQRDRSHGEMFNFVWYHFIYRMKNALVLLTFLESSFKGIDKRWSCRLSCYILFLFVQPLALSQASSPFDQSPIPNQQTEAEKLLSDRSLFSTITMPPRSVIYLVLMNLAS